LTGKVRVISKENFPALMRDPLGFHASSIRILAAVQPDGRADA
jgi:hypothetical protein